jgi:hypothetical protein
VSAFFAALSIADCVLRGWSSPGTGALPETGMQAGWATIILLSIKSVHVQQWCLCYQVKNSKLRLEEKGFVFGRGLPSFSSQVT